MVSRTPPPGTRIPHTVVKTVVTYTPIDYELGVHITLPYWFYQCVMMFDGARGRI